MSDWIETTLGDAATIKIGRTPPTKDPKYWTDNLARPFCTIADMTGTMVRPHRQGVTAEAEAEGKAKRFPADTLLMSFKLSIGRVGFAACDLFPNEAIAGLEPRTNDLDKRFLAYALGSQDLTAGSGRAVKGSTLNGASLRAIHVYYPPLPEQRRIVAVMSAVDAQGEALEGEREALETAYSHSLSLLWLNADGSEAELRRLNDLMCLDLHRVKVDPEVDYPIAGVLNAGKGLISRGQVSGASTGYDNLNRLREGQAVMRKLTAWEGPIGIVPRGFDGFFASVEFPTFTLGDQLSPRYFDNVCRSSRLWDEMKNRVTGSVQRRKRLNPDQLLSVALPVPPVDVQVQVAAALDELRTTGDALTAELAALQAVRAGLLSALLSREITVDEAVDQFVPEAA